MSDKNTTTVSGGGGCFTTVGIVFIVLKLVGVINWSWFWVLSPFILGIALSVLLLVLFAVVAVAASYKPKPRQMKNITPTKRIVGRRMVSVVDLPSVSKKEYEPGSWMEG